jgi:catechol 2,3-dioxygenase-like lactoylglutathione lyase family enzyme
LRHGIWSSELSQPISDETLRVHKLARFGLTTQHLGRLVRFFELAFDCREIARERRSGTGFVQIMGVRGGATSVTLRLGDASIEILEFDYPGRPYVPDLSPYDNEFQHFALVVEDMDAAYSRLSSVTGWSSISSAGPQHLPASSGGVKAFKFRDPDGHPLELLSFPQDRTPERWRDQAVRPLFLGIDHSAMSCSNAAASIDFYQAMGLLLTARSFNHGIEQERLDGIPTPQLDVFALAPEASTPHVELLCYRDRATRRASSIRSNDIGATRLIFERDSALLSGASDRLILDPDGHHLLVTSMVPGTLES